MGSFQIPERQEEVNWLFREFLDEPAQDEGAHAGGSSAAFGTASRTADEVVELLCKDSDRRAIFEGGNLGYTSDSEADGRLFSNAAYFCERDTVLMREVSERSARKRSKWYEKRKHTDWLGWELDKAAERQTGTIDPKRNIRFGAKATPSTNGHTRGRSQAGAESKGESNSEQAGEIPPEKLSATKVLADVICSDNHFAQDAGGKLYRYSEGAYRLYAERYIQQQVKAVLEQQGLWDKWSSHRASEVVEYIRVDAPDLWERPPLDRVNIANGILDLNTRTLSPHSPDFLSPVQLPVEYDPEARCPEWERFARTTFPSDAQELAFEIIADLMTPDRSIQKALLLIGEGDNGKSVYLRAVGAFVGSANVAGVSIHKLESDRFAASRLVGKLANICPDLPSEHLSQTSVFKALTGGDVLNAEYKYRESFEYIPYARMLFSANSAPRASDASHAFFRRWMVVPFEASFSEEEKLPREVLDARLSDPQELSGVLNKALEVRDKVRQRGFTESDSMREAAEEFRQMTDPVSVWLDQNTVEGAEAFVSKDGLAQAYNASRDKSGQAGMNKKAFGKALKRARPHVEDGRRSVSGAMVHCWIGIGLKSNEPDSTNGETVGTVGTVGKSATCSADKKIDSSRQGTTSREKGDTCDSSDTESELWQKRQKDIDRALSETDHPPYEELI